MYPASATAGLAIGTLDTIFKLKSGSSNRLPDNEKDPAEHKVQVVALLHMPKCPWRRIPPAKVGTNELILGMGILLHPVSGPWYVSNMAIPQPP